MGGGARVRAREPSRGPRAVTLGSRLRGSTLGSWARGSRKFCRRKGRLGRRLIKPNVWKRPVADVPWIGSISSISRSYQGETKAVLTNQLKAATVGFAITVAPLAIVAVAQNVLMPQVVAVVQEVVSDDQAWMVASLRSEWLRMHTIVVMLIAIYWLLTALFGRGQLLSSKAANLSLALCVFTYLTMTIYFTFFQRPDDLRGVCPFLSISDTDAPSFAFDGRSSCGHFIYAAHQLLILGMLGLVVPLTGSLIVRIVSSRRARFA
ncbi:hypothetical protein GGQ81_000680 [Sphingomonas desiccabilis]|nr:hypothetical protein [Sphingomonas desiccabilis]